MSQDAGPPKKRKMEEVEGPRLVKMPDHREREYVPSPCQDVDLILQPRPQPQTIDDVRTSYMLMSEDVQDTKGVRDPLVAALAVENRTLDEGAEAAVSYEEKVPSVKKYPSATQLHVSDYSGVDDLSLRSGLDLPANSSLQAIVDKLALILTAHDTKSVKHYLEHVQDPPWYFDPPFPAKVGKYGYLVLCAIASITAAQRPPGITKGTKEGIFSWSLEAGFKMQKADDFKLHIAHLRDMKRTQYLHQLFQDSLGNLLELSEEGIHVTYRGMSKQVVDVQPPNMYNVRAVTFSDGMQSGVGEISPVIVDCNGLESFHLYDISRVKSICVVCAQLALGTIECCEI
jgi:hypothetical protein